MHHGGGGGVGMPSAAVAAGSSMNAASPPPTPQCSYERTCSASLAAVSPGAATGAPPASAAVTLGSHGGGGGGGGGSVNSGNGLGSVGISGIPLQPPEPATEPKAEEPSDEFDADLEALASQLQSFDWKEDVTNTAKKMLESRTPEDNLAGVLRFKKMLCIARQHVFQVADDVIKAGVLPRLVAFVSDDTHFELQLAAAFCLTNVAAGDDSQTDSVVEAGAVPVLMNLLDLHAIQLRRQAIFCLANIAGSTPENRRNLLSVPHYCRRVMHSAELCQDPKIEAIAAWNLRNICVLPEFSLEGSEYAIRYFTEFLCDCRDPLNNWTREYGDIERYACEALAHVCSLAVGKRYVMENSGNALVDVCLKTVPQGVVTSSSRLLYLDVLYEIARNSTALEKEAMFASNAENVLASCLANSSAGLYKIRTRALEILNALATGECQPSFSARMLSSKFCHVPTELNSFLERGNGIAAAMFAFGGPSIMEAEQAAGPSVVDLSLDICFQRNGAEDQVVRQAAAILVCRVSANAPIDCVSMYPRSEEVLTLALEVIEFESSQELQNMLSGGGGGGSEVAVGGGGGGIGGAGSGVSGFEGAGGAGDVDVKSVRGLENSSRNLCDGLGVVEKLVEVGKRVGQSRGGGNPVLVALEQMSAGARLREVLGRTQSIEVSEKIVRMISRDFEFTSIPM